MTKTQPSMTSDDPSMTQRNLEKPNVLVMLTNAKGAKFIWFYLGYNIGHYVPAV